MAKISLKLKSQEEPLAIEGELSDIRRMAFHFNKMLAGEPTEERRFVIRGSSGQSSTTLYLDLTQVLWLLIEDQMIKDPADEE